MSYTDFEEKVKRTVYFDNLSPQVTPLVIKTALAQFGDVKDIIFIPNYVRTNSIPACALVEMENANQAKSVVFEVTKLPFMMSGMPRPARARPAEAQMFADRPQKPGFEVKCQWLDPKDPDFHVAKKLTVRSKIHVAEAAFALKYQLDKEEALSNAQADTLKSNHKKIELFDNLMHDGSHGRLARRYNVNILGSCGSSLKCTGAGETPASLAEFTLASPDFYDVSLVDGFNLPVVVTPINGYGNCSVAGCDGDLRPNCPKELAMTKGGKTVGFMPTMIRTALKHVLELITSLRSALPEIKLCVLITVTSSSAAHPADQNLSIENGGS
ncbi:hypothetical protein GIB67_025888 [Kingdonia uniflora]|uniref:RRM domain-containing protein n=1 Tax=Kingdonia uniflora TaxID=39325 RepID=A0A7J7LXJ7_9MAGN|nr:hypothetical protein GIB67_025888 [Kingdonia uniflora]